MTTRLLVVFALAVVAALVATAPQARACSCAAQDPDEHYREADAAVIGTVVAADDKRATLRVDHEFKVDLPAEIVLDNGEEDSCGLGLERGDEQVGLFLSRDGDGWTSSLCQRVAPDDLPGARDRLPPPAGRGTASLLAHGEFSGGRLAALDAEGGLLAYGAGRGDAVHVSVCPRSDRVVELAYDERRPWIAVRRLRDMAILFERRFPLPGRPRRVQCNDDRGEAVTVAVDRPRGRDDLIVALDRGRPSVTWRSRSRAIELAGDFAFVDEGKRRGMRAVNVSLRTGWRLPGVRAYTSDWVISPDGTRAAAITTGSDRPRTGEAALVVVQLGGKRWVIQRKLDLHWLDASVLWLSNDRLLLGGDSNALRLYDGRLRPLRRYATEFTPIKLILQGDRIYGIGDGLHVAEAPGYVERILGRLPAPGLYNLVAIPGGAEINTLG
jgi:hypothetical protein